MLVNSHYFENQACIGPIRVDFKEEMPANWEFAGHPAILGLRPASLR